MNRNWGYCVGVAPERSTLPVIILASLPAPRPTPANFRLVHVVEARFVTPHVRRVTLAGQDMARFACDEHIHVGLMIPQAGVAPVWPVLEADGQVTWPSGPGSPALRRYTIRRHDMRRGTVDIDFVVHEDGGPGSAFARHAKAGDVLGMLGPGGGGIPPAADWYLLAGDETGLPAIARMLETLPPEARGVALIEVGSAADEQPITTRSGVELRWLHRHALAPGTTGLLADAVRQLAFPPADTSLFAWAACEFDAFKAIRSHLRRERGLTQAQHLVVSYWRRGRSEDD
jgi:NADPH-dependent ferric siderophore reductase